MSTATMIRPVSLVARCDICPGRAVIDALRPGVGILTFCRHHGAQHRDTLVRDGWIIVDMGEEVTA